MFRAYGFTDKGCVRPTNEDYFGVEEPLRLCIVADGIGGHNAGEVAARVAVDAVVDHIQTGETRWPFGFDPELSEAGNLLRTAVHLANVQVLEAAGRARQFAGMGTTIVAALVRGARLSVAYVGDSRLYLYQGQPGVRHVPDTWLGPARLRRLTTDDSWMATILAREPNAEPQMLRHHPMRHALTNVVGARPETDVHIVEEELRHGALLALTTDGVHGLLDDRQIERRLAAGDDLADMAAGLVGSALACGSRDNCTAVVAQYLAD